jgi:hypothetical protein
MNLKYVVRRFVVGGGTKDTRYWNCSTGEFTSLENATQYAIESEARHISRFISTQGFYICTIGTKEV